MIRRVFKFRPALIVAFVLLWTFHFSFGMFHHYHPDYAHAHDGELHAHSGHFHSLELEHLAHFIEPGHAPHADGETHHHSESLPGNDSQTVQYDVNKSSLPKAPLALDSTSGTAPVALAPAQLNFYRSLRIASDADRFFRHPRFHSERSPPLRL